MGGPAAARLVSARPASMVASPGGRARVCDGGGVLRRCHTVDLTPAELAAARALLDLSFRDFSDHDWDHSLGGAHALVVEEGRLLAYGTLVDRELQHGGWRLRCGYVEAVAVHRDHRRRGLASTVMAALEELARRTTCSR